MELLLATLFSFVLLFAGVITCGVVLGVMSGQLRSYGNAAQETEVFVPESSRAKSAELYINCTFLLCCCTKANSSSCQPVATEIVAFNETSNTTFVADTCETDFSHRNDVCWQLEDEGIFTNETCTNYMYSTFLSS
jgi:hypothetical protein